MHLLLAVIAGWLSLLGALSPGSDWGWPLRPDPAVLHPFQAPATRYGTGHRGVDLTGTMGQPVLAAGDGVVSHSGVIAGRGTISVRHPNGWRTTYEPVDDRVATGTVVRRGDRLGSLDAQGHCGPTTCLHWGLIVAKDTYRNPLLLLRDRRVVLLPP